ncbi:MAG TPA: choice-of-anchor L domain-containing protein, partial [Flavobacterium sp.]
MKKLLLLTMLFAFSLLSHAQLTVTNNQTPAQLVQNVLLGSGISVTNIKFNGVAVNASFVRDQVGFFNNGASTNLGINQGVVMATGKVVIPLPPGPFDAIPIASANNAGSATNPTSSPGYVDGDLASIAGPQGVNTSAVIEFDFVPTGEDLSFNYVFGSEEYPEWVGTTFNDVFGFFLSGPGISGPFSNGGINIAIVPGTANTPVSINNLNNGNPNGSDCVNCAYYVNNGTGTTPGVNTTIQLDGFTTVLTASATVQCGETYHIKLAIANVGDNGLDSAVFLQANSFNSTPLELPDDYLVSNGFAVCYGQTTEICTGLGDGIVHEWFHDGELINGVTGECYTITEPGEYCVTAYPFGAACPVNDCMTIEYQQEIPVVEDPGGLCEEDLIFDLTDIEPEVLGSINPSDLANISYHNSFADAEVIFNPIISNLNNYPGTVGEQIYIRVENFTGCYVIVAFTLSDDCGSATTPPDMVVCDDPSNNGTAIFDLTTQTPLVLDENLPAEWTVTYHLNQADADADAAAISPADNFVGTNGQTIYVRMEDNADPGNFDVVFFQLIVNPLPVVTISGSTTICSGNTGTITFTGTPLSTVTYTIDAGANQTVVLNAAGTAIV